MFAVVGMFDYGGATVESETAGVSERREGSDEKGRASVLLKNEREMEVGKYSGSVTRRNDFPIPQCCYLFPYDNRR